MEKIIFKNFPYKTTPLNDTNLNQLQTNVENALDDKVDKVAGKGLSTSDYTTSEKNKLAGIEPGANKTTIADNLTTDDSTKALSAKQGKLLNDTKFDKTGGTVTGDVNIEGELKINGVSTKKNIIIIGLSNTTNITPTNQYYRYNIPYDKLYYSTGEELFFDSVNKRINCPVGSLIRVTTCVILQNYSGDITMPINGVSYPPFILKTINSSNTEIFVSAICVSTGNINVDLSPQAVGGFTNSHRLYGNTNNLSTFLMVEIIN